MPPLTMKLPASEPLQHVAGRLAASLQEVARGRSAGPRCRSCCSRHRPEPRAGAARAAPQQRRHRAGAQAVVGVEEDQPGRHWHFARRGFARPIRPRRHSSSRRSRGSRMARTIANGVVARTVVHHDHLGDVALRQRGSRWSRRYRPRHSSAGITTETDALEIIGSAGARVLRRGRGGRQNENVVGDGQAAARP